MSAPSSLFSAAVPVDLTRGNADHHDLGRALAAGAVRFGGVAISFAGAEGILTTTLGALYAEAERVGTALAGLGLRQGDVLVCQVPHCAEAVSAFLACVMRGIVFVPVVHIFGPAELGFILRQSKARALLVPARWRNIDFAERIGAVRTAGFEGLVVTIGDAGIDAPTAKWNDLARTEPSAAQHPLDGGEPCCLLYTSGTTSVPKGVIHTRSTILAESLGISAFFDATGPLPMLVGSPAGHIGGIVAMVRPYILGIVSGFLDRWDTDLAIRLITEKALAWCNAVPFHIRAVIPAASAGKLPSFRFAIVGGASVPPSLVRDADQVGIRVCRSYGSTEHPTVTYSLPTDPIELRAESDGRCVNGNEILIVDDDGRPLPGGTPGEVWTRGPERFAGYFDSALDQEALGTDGWYRTGDIGVVSAAGYLTIVDRKKDIIIRGGENISSREIEDIATSHPAVAEAAAIGWPDAALGERVGVFLRLHPGRTLTIEELQAHFRDCGVARQKSPERLVLLGDFPRNASGKVLKAELRRRARLASASATDRTADG
ncbi:MAG: AMP-binding protein [Hyphomicrobiaceae bacterium]